MRSPERVHGSPALACGPGRAVWLPPPPGGMLPPGGIGVAGVIGLAGVIGVAGVAGGAGGVCGGVGVRGCSRRGWPDERLWWSLSHPAAVARDATATSASVWVDIFI